MSLVVVVGVLTLSVLPLTVFGMPGLLFMVDIHIPQTEGRNEIDDITSIKSILSGFTRIHTFFAMKALDNQEIRLSTYNVDFENKQILILDVEDMCYWPALTSAISKKGYKMSVTELEDCSVYAARLGVDITYAPLSVFRENSLYLTVERHFDKTDLRGQEYQDEIKRHFEFDVTTNPVQGSRCYVALMDTPVRLFYVSVGTLEKVMEIVGKNNVEDTANTNYQMFQSLDIYSETC